MSKLSVDDLPQTGLQVEVVCMILSCRNCNNENSQRGTNKNLVKNIAHENWCEVSNALLQCEKLAPQKKNIAIHKAVSKEFNDYLNTLIHT